MPSKSSWKSEISCSPRDGHEQKEVKSTPKNQNAYAICLKARVVIAHKCMCTYMYIFASNPIAGIHSSPIIILPLLEFFVIVVVVILLVFQIAWANMAVLIRLQKGNSEDEVTTRVADSRVETSSSHRRNYRTKNFENTETITSQNIVETNIILRSTSCTTFTHTSSKMADIATPTFSSPIKAHQHSSSNTYLHVESVDEESSRGRKRRRSSHHSPPPHLLSNASATLRGRARRRSPSVEGTLSQEFQRVRSPSPGNPDRRSPGRKYLKKDFEMKETKQRSQSPSRSRTRGMGGHGETEQSVKPRRRQRTRSRTRKHGEEEQVGDGNGLKLRVGNIRKEDNHLEGKEMIDDDAVEDD